MRYAFAVLSLAILAPAQSPPIPDMKSIHKVFIDKMPNDLDQYLRAEFSKQFKGKVIVVLKKEDADGIITGIDEETKGTGAKITGRYLGGDSGEAERWFRREAERHSGMIPNTIGA